jgi:hypothetical protein
MTEKDKDLRVGVWRKQICGTMSLEYSHGKRIFTKQKYHIAGGKRRFFDQGKIRGCPQFICWQLGFLRISLNLIEREAFRHELQ